MYFYDDPDDEEENSVINDEQENEQTAQEAQTDETQGEEPEEQGDQGGQRGDGLASSLEDLASKKSEIENGKAEENLADSSGVDNPPKSRSSDGNDSKGSSKTSEGNDKPEGLKTGGGNPVETAKTGGLDKGNIASAALKGAGEDGAQGAAKEALKETAKQEAKKQFMKMGGQAFMNSLSAAIAPLIPWIVLIVLLIIIVVGIVMFFVAVPGQIVGKFKNLGNNVIKAWSAMIQGGDEVVSTSQIAEVAAYVEKMGYDLKGEGFVSSDKTAEDIPQTISDIESWTSTDYNPELAEAGNLSELLIADENQGVIRRNDTGDVVDLNSDPILTYIISDNQCYMIKNFNVNLDEMTGGHGDFWGNLLAAVAVVAGVLVAILVPGGILISAFLGLATTAGVAGASYLAVTLQSNPDWGNGLISIYHEESLGKAGAYYDQMEKGSIYLDANTKKLSVQRGWSNGAYTFDVDGWSGRYGMPLEFLLSVHLATQMPDLAIDMATSFDTDVEVLLHEVNGTMTAGVLKSTATGTNDEDFITYAEVADIGKAERSLLSAAWEGVLDFVNFIGGVFTGGGDIWTDEELDQLAFNDRALGKLLDMGMYHSESCTCCYHIEGSKADASADDACEGDADNVYDDKGNVTDEHVFCDACKERVMKLIAAIKVCNDKEWESYTPYISKVTDHWFRDVYFVMNDDEYDTPNGESEFAQNVIQVDEDYFYETNERWTMYEVWEEGESMPEGFEVGDYKLYDPDNMNSPSTKTLAEVQEINEKIANGDTSVTRLVKKAITQNLDKTTGIENFSGWSAYEITDKETGDEIPWEKMSVDKNAKGELLEPAVYKGEVAENPDDILIYYKETRPADVKQVEDGQRTETNPTIKDMFLNRAYYRYDGSTTRADAIYEDRIATADSTDQYNKENDPRNPDLIAKVNITKDSLGAFSILENTHTLDADYVYRDFKELIVELNYFDKEDLSDKVAEVMQWPIPECGSAGWPIRKYEKGETFYGTLINSKVDLDYMKEIDVKKAEVQLNNLKEEVPLEGEGVETTPTSGITNGLQATNNSASNSWVVGAVSSSANPSISVDQFVQTGYDVHKIMEDGGGWDYCILNPSDGCNHKYGHSCGLNSTIQEAQEQYHNTCCATFTSWVLKEAGFDLSNHPNMHGATSSYNWCKDNGWTEITDYNSLEAGDFLFNAQGEDSSNIGDIGHVQMLGNDGEWLNAGSVNAINDPPKSYKAGFIIGMRPPLNGVGQPFEGYEPEQAVVAPITGKIVDYGQVTRKNEETGEDEKVDFIKIQAIDHYTTSGKGKTVLSECTDAEKTYEENNTDSTQKEGYDYFYEEYRGVIDGCVLYMEGFDLTLDETLAASDMESDEVTQYEANPVYNMTNNIKEAQAYWREDAKSAALPFFKDGEDIYIKEGTVIGKTSADAEGFPPEIITDESGMPTSENPKGNGNYIRLILRDLEDSIMEDVESYFNIEDTNMSKTQPYQAQPGDLELLANLLHHEGCEAYFKTRSVFSGKPEQARDASRVTGYVLLNRAILNYGGHGTTIREQILAPGQYSTAYDVTEGEADYCDLCLANAEWCLTYDCNSVTSPTSNQPMPRNVVGQSGWCQCSSDIGEFNCWWWVDTTGDGAKTEHSGSGSAFDTFYCINSSFPSS